MDRPLDAREQIALAAVANASVLTFVTLFLPSGFWSTAPRGYVVGAVALTPGLVLGLVESGPALGRRGAVDLVLSAVLAWYVGFGLLLHGEFVIVAGYAPTTAFGHFSHRVGLAISGWLPLGVVGYVSGTVARVGSSLLQSLLGRIVSGRRA